MYDLNYRDKSKDPLNSVKLVYYLKYVVYKGWIFKRVNQQGHNVMKSVHERALNLMPGCKPFWATLQDCTLKLYTDSNTKELDESFDLRSAEISRIDNNLIEIKAKAKVDTIVFDDTLQRNNWYFLVTYILTNTSKNEEVEVLLHQSVRSVLRHRECIQKVVTKSGFKCRPFDMKAITSDIQDQGIGQYYTGEDKKVVIH